MDADQSHSPSDIPRLLSMLRIEDDGDAHFVIIWHNIPGGSCDYGGYRKFLSVGENWLTITVAGIPLHEFATSF
jgi:hypothetical protein